ncbi:SDR family oxidoreductase [Pantoea sp. LMR881]|uniref:SDR family oxidoreductase n=1 Tax=Pantoea sp. LMR881 TaxID=3014336 RepID=UPI0022AFAA6E|nr:SDR family oxidoreductase [Pantoea sp. LMR881]MCZ4061633.1 SDR family oxidoreductase [Pantoea sp. LMR881]
MPGPAWALSDWQRGCLTQCNGSKLYSRRSADPQLASGMQARGFGRIVNITSAMVKSPHYMMGLSTSARTALTAICKAISQDVAKDNVTINNLLPERIDTPRQEFMLQRLIAKESISREEARLRNVQSIAARRYGTPQEFGAACAFLCSQQASFISGQNLQLDGGSYDGLV